jgi:lipid II:glycine glycyltransferase (peptidoglycan interpeptide bridge formation enzyme)
LNAHHLILWRAIEELRERGVRILDLGGVNTIRSAGVARFKMRTGGKVLTLAGTYI